MHGLRPPGAPHGSTGSGAPASRAATHQLLVFVSGSCRPGVLELCHSATSVCIGAACYTMQVPRLCGPSPMPPRRLAGRRLLANVSYLLVHTCLQRSPSIPSSYPATPAYKTRTHVQHCALLFPALPIPCLFFSSAKTCSPVPAPHLAPRLSFFLTALPAPEQHDSATPSLRCT